MTLAAYNQQVERCERPASNGGGQPYLSICKKNGEPGCSPLAVTSLILTRSTVLHGPKLMENVL